MVYVERLLSEHLRSRNKEMSEQTGLSEGDYGVLDRLALLGNGNLRQQELADSMDWDKSRLSHHLTRMENADL